MTILDMARVEIFRGILCTTKTQVTKPDSGRKRHDNEREEWKELLYQKCTGTRS